MFAYPRVMMIPAAASLLFYPLAAIAQNLSSQDRQFVEETMKSGMQEVHLGQMGVERGASPDVKSFSQRLINDHNSASRELAAFAKQKDVKLPADDAKLAAPVLLGTETGGEFDRDFKKMIIEDHQKLIVAFEKEISSGSDPDIKKWASKTLPTLRAHLMEARELIVD